MRIICVFLAMMLLGVGVLWVGCSAVESYSMAELAQLEKDCIEKMENEATPRYFSLVAFCDCYVRQDKEKDVCLEEAETAVLVER